MPPFNQTSGGQSVDTSQVADAPSWPTRRQVHQRTGELANLDGRAPWEIRHSDYLRARRELTGETDFQRQESLLDQADDVLP
jgi:hypothetical protein